MAYNEADTRAKLIDPALKARGDSNAGSGNSGFVTREATVVSRLSSGSRSLLRLSDGTQLSVRRFAPLGRGDLLRYGDGRLSVLARKDHEWLDLTDPWHFSAILNLADEQIPIVFKELTDEEELLRYHDLSRFHYRGGGGAGRSVPLIATSNVWDIPALIGFVEICSSMIANTARRTFFSAPYQENNALSWVSWDRRSAKEFSNIICRVSRLVVHPELRGLGFSRHFLEAARRFAADRWHFGGYKPRFLEITAEMLRFYPFVDDKFAFMGATEGNEHRLEKDISYLVRRGLTADGTKGMPQGGGGIMTLQRGYALQVIRYMKKFNKTLPEVIAALKYDLSALDQTAWEALYKVTRRPKPCYVSGLNVAAEEYVQARSRTLSSRRAQPDKRPLECKNWAIKKLSIEASSAIEQSATGRLLQDTFGFVGSSVKTTLVSDFSFTLESGTITLVCGASGSGKSVFMRAVSCLLNSGRAEPVREGGGLSTAGGLTDIEVTGEVTGTAKLSTLRSVELDRTSISYIGHASMEEFLQIAASCGLAEPQLLVRSIRTLSSGQRYRLRLALAFLDAPEVLAVDNFCEPLDRYTTVAVCKGLRRLVRRYNTAVLVASAAYDRVRNALKPDQEILLRRGHHPAVGKGRDEFGSDLSEGVLL